MTNTGNDDFTFTAALHTYYRVKNIDKVCFTRPRCWRRAKLVRAAAS